ncbi:MAG: H/ACA RNA-protein complex protein Gar1 [Sulfolobaceae archaeon]
MRFQIIEFGTFEKITLKNKWLLKLNNKNNYLKLNPIGKIVIDENGNRVGKVLDVIGNIDNPYALVKPLIDEQPKGKLYLEIPRAVEKKKKRRK